MDSIDLKERLRDPDYLDLHLAAVSALRDVGRVPWYDAHFLKQYEAARKYLSLVRPSVLSEFEDGFEPIRQVEDKPIEIQPDFYPADLHEEIREIARSIPKRHLELHEMEDFGRHVVHDHDFFNALQRKVLPRVEDMAERKLEPGYNFLSLYGGEGKCAPHMDEPESMYTLDYCIDQSEAWPIYFSNLVQWPDSQAMENWKPADVLEDADIRFTEHNLEPNQALLFTGSSRWHYRNSIKPGGFCSLLFFHYFPAGCSNLIYPERWGDQFEIEELQPLCDLFLQTRAERY